MASLELAGAAGALDNINATQAEFRAQIAALNDLMRQVAGVANVAAGSAEMVDPLTAPFTLYVNPYIGQDTFAAGSFNTYEAPGGSTDEEIIEAKLKRLDNQRLTCGFSPQRPFKTINRAVIEAAIITSKNWYTITDPKAHLDCVSIVLAPGVHTVYNDPGSGTPVTWTDGYEPTPEDLIKFNPTDGGVLLPRGCSLCGPDLRKCTFRPSWVPGDPNDASTFDELADRSNRSEIFKITGTGYFFGFTFFDKINSTTSHNLLSGFGFASKTELDAFYTKVRTYVGSPANLSNTLAVTRQTEYEIVGPIDDTPSADWDTTASASPYIFNCSVRSEYGMGGIHADGAKVEGLKSMVTANYTGVSLQKDMRCWQRYNGSSWEQMPDYTTYINSDPNNVRMKPTRRSFHIRAINNAFIQEVSIFAIGQGVHHSTESGGEITVTNSNSSFGGCVAISSGYKTSAFDIDTKWRFAYFKVPVNISEKTNNIQKFYLGRVGSYTDDQPYLNLETALSAQEGSTIVPEVIGRYGYTLRRGSYVWVENPNGNDYRAQLSTTKDPWSTADPDRIYFVDGASLQAFNDAESSEQAPGSDNAGVNRAIGRRVYIRRLQDTRSDSERKLTIGMFSILASTRLAQRDYVLQLDPVAEVFGDVDPYVNGTLPTSNPLAISSVLSTTISDANFPDFTGDIQSGMEIQLQRLAPEVDYAVSTFYREGTTVVYNNKHYTAVRDVTTAASGGPSATDWQESYVHMASDYRAGDKLDNTSYTLLLDDDSSDDVNSTTLGYDLAGLWTDASPSTVEKALQDQYRSSNDYLGAYALLRDLGFSETASHAALQPRATADRVRYVNNTTHFPTAPSGGKATARNCWAAEWRRPSVLRLFGHAFEWAGTLNYSKAFPAAQKELTPINKFTYYYTNELGGRAYATGFNEEGYLVRPTGIEDISTGESRSLTSLATVDSQPVNAFPAGIDAGGSSTINDLEIVGTVTFNYAANTDDLGPVILAGRETLQSEAYPGRNAATPLTETEFNIAINNGNQPNVVTLPGLNYWREYHALLSAKALSFETGTDADEYPISGMLGRMAFVDEWCGYAQGGGSVTQATSKSTGVELNTPCGQITMHNASLAADTAVAFTLTNSQIAPQDVVAVSIKSGATAGAYAVSTLDIASGSVKIVLRNLTAGALAEAVVLNFVLIKSTTTA